MSADDRLTVDSGETYSVESGESVEWSGVDVNGTLDVDGNLKLIDDPDIPDDDGFRPGVEPIQLPIKPIELPVSAPNLSNMQVGLSIFLVGLMSLLLGAVALLKNYIAGVVWGLALVALLMSGLLGIGLEVFWALVAGTVITLIAGMVVRWIN